MSPFCVLVVLCGALFGFAILLHGAWRDLRCAR